MNDLSSLMLFLGRCQVPFDIFAEPEFIEDKALESGANLCISIRGVAHLYFNGEGEMVGSGTDSAKSYIPKKG